MRQIAALPYTSDPIDGSMQILLITSRDTGRWVIPKGNRIKGLAGHRAAEVEAFEEAGIHGIACPAPIGRYSYDKRKRSGKSREANVEVFPLAVTGHLTQWPEKGQRELRWFPSPKPQRPSTNPNCNRSSRLSANRPPIRAGSSGCCCRSARSKVKGLECCAGFTR
jgi:8-oxo-dGTP pyrophosphatase MutT (NUDIX family)